MSNHLNSDQQLDQAVKEALDSYEVPFEASAWAEMEKTLATAPRSYHPFRKWSFSLNTIIGIAALAGGMLIFKYSTSGADNSASQAVKVETPAPQKIQPQYPAPKQEPAVTTAVTATEETTTVAGPANEQPQVATLTNSSKETSGAKEASKKKKREKTSTNETASTEPTEIDFMKMTESRNTTPAFGDQIDPVKGFILGTNESDKMKKLAESKLFGDSTTPIKTDTTSSFKLSKPSDDTDTSGSKKKKRERNRKESKKDPVPEGTTTDAGTKSTNNDSSDDKSDTSKVKKNTKQQPKYKGERTIIDP